MLCRPHQNTIPCKICVTKELDRCILENTEREKAGRHDLHDIEALRKIVDSI